MATLSGLGAEEMKKDPEPSVDKKEDGMMDTMNTVDTTSATRGVMFYFTAFLAVLTCPCHVPILLLLLSGTAAGAFLQENPAGAVGLLLSVFLLSAFAAWRLFETKGK